MGFYQPPTPPPGLQRSSSGQPFQGWSSEPSQQTYQLHARRHAHYQYRRRRQQQFRLFILGMLSCVILTLTISGVMAVTPTLVDMSKGLTQTVSSQLQATAPSVVETTEQSEPSTNPTQFIQSLFPALFMSQRPPTILERLQAHSPIYSPLFRETPLLAQQALLSPLDYSYQGEALPMQKKLLPLLPLAEDQELKQQLETLFAPYQDRFRPHLYFYDPKTRTYVGINEAEDVAAASMIKVPVLLAYFQQVDEGSLTTDTPLLYQEFLKAGGAGELQYKDSGVTLPANVVAAQMIQISDNTCTNMMIDSVGGLTRLNSRLREWGLQNTITRNWLPDLEGTNRISMVEMATLLHNLQNALESRQFLSPSSSQQAIQIMLGTHNKRLLPAQLPDNLPIAHKTGDIGGALGDIGIVYLDRSLPLSTQSANEAATFAHPVEIQNTAFTSPDIPAGLISPMLKQPALPNTNDYYVVAIQFDRPYNDYTARDLIQQASRLIYNRAMHARGYTTPEASLTQKASR